MIQYVRPHMRNNPMRSNPKVTIKNGFAKIYFTVDEVRKFNSQWPSSTIPDDNPIWFELDARNGDLVDYGSSNKRVVIPDSQALLALSQDAQDALDKYLGLGSEWMRSNPGTGISNGVPVQLDSISHRFGHGGYYVNPDINNAFPGEQISDYFKPKILARNPKLLDFSNPAIVSALALAGLFIWNKYQTTGRIF